MSDLDLDDHHVDAVLDGPTKMKKSISERLEKSMKDTFGIKNHQREQQANQANARVMQNKFSSFIMDQVEIMVEHSYTDHA